MCGIIGHFGQLAQLANVNGVQSLLAHRGPDSSGSVLLDSNVYLGHTRLSIRDISSAGNQPMRSPDGKVCLVYNGEIYNCEELKGGLASRGISFASTCDTEVLVAGLMLEGAGFVERVKGDFALAAYFFDSKELVLIRDRFGVKPLYFFNDDSGFSFASEIKGLLPFMRRRELDPLAVVRHQQFVWNPAAQTAIKGVVKVRPGEMIIVNHAGWRSVKWYKPSFSRSGAVPAYRDAEDQLRDCVSGAVRRQLVSDVNVGVFLSGGLDSSAVSYAAKEYAGPLPAFTVNTVGGVSEGDTDDLPYARLVAKRLGLPLHEVQIKDSDLADGLVSMVWNLDEPLSDPAPLNVLRICEAARHQGVKVMMSGAGGDDLFTGYRRHSVLNAFGGMRWGAKNALRAAAFGYAKGTARRRKLEKAAYICSARSLSDFVVRAFEWVPYEGLSRYVSSEVLECIDPDEIAEPLHNTLLQVDSTDPVDLALALEECHFLPDHNLCYTDKMSMAAGVEVRVPLLDGDLRSLAWSLPRSYLQTGVHGKRILKSSFAPVLGSDVVYRAKSGFGLPIRDWLMTGLKEI